MIARASAGAGRAGASKPAAAWYGSTVSRSSEVPVAIRSVRVMRMLLCATTIVATAAHPMCGEIPMAQTVFIAVSRLRLNY
jgi:hypothetical protein